MRLDGGWWPMIAMACAESIRRDMLTRVMNQYRVDLVKLCGFAVKEIANRV